MTIFSPYETFPEELQLHNYISPMQVSDFVSGSCHLDRASKLVLNVKYLLLLSFLTVPEFYTLGHIQGIIRVH